MGESDRPNTEKIPKLESPSTDSQLVGSLSNGWTDEKHVIFLNCIESAFVNELYNEKYETNAFHGWLSRMKMPKGSCGQCENDQKAGQFKVLRMSSWKNFIYDMDKIDAETETGLMPLSANPWIQHFRPTCIMKEKNLKSSDKIDYSHLTRPSVHLENDGHYGEGTSSKHNCCQDSVGSSAEVSDQNFVDDELISEKRSTISLKRKPGAQVAHNSINNQLPSKKAFVSPISVANHTSLCTVNSESSSRTWEVDSILVLSETEAPLYDDEEVNS
ncbi:cold-regulated protein 27-like [Zingiber officinale]|uniref:cold-regulated protein 27-like n=1 Tax=Zingiber officinale TaxID=94328 RepID=UPI001C4B7B91|nr:cold-regulated protein 27-like [Zingiber officinale]